jgi:hypothetical protein
MGLSMGENVSSKKKEGENGEDGAEPPALYAQLVFSLWNTASTHSDS